MGDRRQIVFQDGKNDPGIWFYTHWHGGALPGLLRNAMSQEHCKARWQDAPYFTRIVISHIVDQVGATYAQTGWGLATHSMDTEHDDIYIDTQLRTITIGSQRYTYDTFIYVDDEKRVCSKCGKKMSEGYCIGDCEEYYCSDECCYMELGRERYISMYEAGTAYWTEWEEEE